MKKYYLETSGKKYELEINFNSEIVKNLFNGVPIEGKGINIGGEIYFNILNDIKYNGQEKEVFEIGDIVYWRSPIIKKFAIAIFYGNTVYGGLKRAQASSPSIKIAKIASTFSDLNNFNSGGTIRIVYK